MPAFSAQCVKGVQGIGYLCAFILSLVICVPMSMHQDQFKGRCLLFSTGVWQEIDGQFKVDWASQAYCNFTIFVAVVMFVVSLFQFCRFVKFFCRGRDSTFFSAFIDVLVCGLMCVVTLIAALFVSLGFKVWCSEMTRRFEQCSDATGNPIDKADGINSDGFYIQISTAQFGVWVSFSVWVTLFVFSMVKLCRYHHQENLRVSMAKERKRLINEDAVTEPSQVHGQTAAGRAPLAKKPYLMYRGRESSSGGDSHRAEEDISGVHTQHHQRQLSGGGGSDNVVCSGDEGSFNADLPHEEDNCSSSSLASSNLQLPKGNRIQLLN